MDSSTLKVSGTWLWFKERDHQGSRGSSKCNMSSWADFSLLHVSLLFPIPPFLVGSPLLLSPLSPLTPDLFSYGFKASTWPSVYPSKWKCYERIWHVWRNFKTHWHPQTTTYEDRYSLPVWVQRPVKAAAWSRRFVISVGKYRAEEFLWAD